MDIVISPTAVALNAQLGSPVPAFQAGEVLDALVLQLLENGAVRLSIGDAVLDVKTQVPLVPGTTVRLAVKNSPEGIKLVVIDPPPPGAVLPSAPGPRGAGTIATNSGPPAIAGETSVPAASSKAAAPAPSTVALQPNPPSQTTTAVASPAIVLAQTVKVAAARQGGLAPLFADLAVVSGIPSGGTAGANAGEVRPLGATAPGPIAPDVLGQGLPTREATMPVPLLASIPAGRSASLAAGNPASASTTPPQVQEPTASPAPPAIPAATLAALPEPVRQVAARLLAMRLPTDSAVTAGDLKQAFSRSGLLFEARVAAAAEAAQGAPHSAVPVNLDLKAALIVFKQVLRTWLDVGTAGDLASGTKPLLPSANVKAEPSSIPGTAAGSAGDPQAPRPAPSLAGPPPPYRGALPTAQPPVSAAIAADATPRDIGARLLADTDAALARHTLLQAASLNAAPSTQPTHSDPSGPRWNFEVPFATPQGTAMAQFEIARDGRAVPAEGIKQVWRARFTLDVEPIGAVHAQIALSGERATVTLWAERTGSAVRLRESASLLTDALQQADLEPGDVLVREGAPPRPRESASPGRFLDRAS